MNPPRLTSHRELAAVTGILVLGFILAWYFLLLPRQEEVRAMRDEQLDLQKKLGDSGWPLESERIKGMLAERSKNAETFSRKADDVFRQATSMFDKSIQERYESFQHFRADVSRLDYQEDFIQIEGQLRSRGIVFGDTLNLKENSDSPYTYQLLLQLWTLRECVTLAWDNGLNIARDMQPPVGAGSAGEFRAPLASRLSVLPVRAYYLTKTDKDPYMLEFPVRLTVTGRIEQLFSYLAALQAGGRFLPVSKIELLKQPPRRDAAAGGMTDRIEVTLECSSFIRLHDDGRPGPIRSAKEAAKPLPRGA